MPRFGKHPIRVDTRTRENRTPVDEPWKVLVPHETPPVRTPDAPWRRRRPCARPERRTQPLRPWCRRAKVPPVKRVLLVVPSRSSHDEGDKVHSLGGGTVRWRLRRARGSCGGGNDALSLVGSRLTMRCLAVVAALMREATLHAADTARARPQIRWLA